MQKYGQKFSPEYIPIHSKNNNYVCACYLIFQKIILWKASYIIEKNVLAYIFLGR